MMLARYQVVCGMYGCGHVFEVATRNVTDTKAVRLSRCPTGPGWIVRVRPENRRDIGRKLGQVLRVPRSKRWAWRSFVKPQVSGESKSRAGALECMLRSLQDNVSLQLIWEND